MEKNNLYMIPYHLTSGSMYESPANWSINLT